MESKEVFTKGFWRMTCQDDYKNRHDGIVETINIEKRSSFGGVQYEFQICWTDLQTKRVARLEMFDDAFIALKDNVAFFEILPHIENPTPDDVQRILLDLEYKDFSDEQLNPISDTRIDTYICYVQNYLGIMDGEDVVSNIAVFVNQADIDNWFLEQLYEARENGFEPSDDASAYLGIHDYELCVSKGDDNDGVTSYGIVCKPHRMKL